jgi:hypothetical protein
MKFERLTDPGPKGGKAAFAKGKTPEQLGVAFAFSRIRIELPPGVNDLGEALRHRVHRLLAALDSESKCDKLFKEKCDPPI